ncbi:MAG: UDP-N-acetylglucosamine 2-epimerase, partial [Planctomycetota bacterium]
MKKILVLSGGRSEFGILDGVCRAIAAREELELSLAVTGVHLLPEYGSTVEQARASGIPVRFEIPFYAAQPIEDAELPASIARGVAGIDGALQEAGADLVLVLGDRPEAMAAALAGYARG